MPPSGHTPFTQTPLWGQLIVCMAWAALVYSHLDRWLGKPLLQQVEVKKRLFFPAQARSPFGSRNSYTANTWSFQVANIQGQGQVRVSQKLYDSTREGDTVFVTGKQGRLSGRWYLEEASKKPPKKR